MKKKLMAAALAAIMISGVLTGCSDKDFAIDWGEWFEDTSESDSGTASSTEAGSDQKPSGPIVIENGKVVSCDAGVRDVSIPDGVTAIADSAFADHSELVSVSFPDSLTGIGSSAFSGCKNLFSVDIPDGVTEIPDNAFAGCTSLTEVRISENVTSIGANAFKDCTALTTLTVPSGLKSLAEDAFTGCASLSANYKQTVYDPKDLIDLCDIVNGNFTRADIPFKQALEILGDLNYPITMFAEKNEFDDINNADMAWLICFVRAKTDALFNCRVREDPDPEGGPMAGGSTNYKFSDIEKYVREYINPGFDAETWKKNAGTWYGNDEEYFKIKDFMGAFGGGNETVLEDCYSIGHNYYLTISSTWMFDNEEITSKVSDWLDGENPSMPDFKDSHLRLIYRKDDDNYYLESVKELKTDELAPWNQALVKMFDWVNDSLKNEYLTALGNFIVEDINNDGIKDFIANAGSEQSILCLIIDGKSGEASAERIVGSTSMSPDDMIYMKDTTTGKTISHKRAVFAYGNESYCSINDDYIGSELCSRYVNQMDRDQTFYRIGGEEVTEAEYNEYTKRFAPLEFEMFNEITFIDFMEAFRASFSK